MVNFTGQAGVVPMTPQTTLILAKGIPWDNQYKHVRLFNSRDSLLSYVRAKAFKEIKNMSPIRMGDLVLQIPYNEMSASNCNYIAWQNLPFDEKWHFAFITSIKPTGQNSCVVNFELDVWHESYYDATLKPCFVDRCHVPKSDDIVGSNTVPENLELGYLKSQKHVDQVPPMDDNDMMIYLATNMDNSGNTVSGDMTNGVYNATRFVVFNNASEANSYIESLINFGGADSIVDCFMCPVSAGDDETAFLTMPKIVSGTIDGYAPKNNKLFTYPYNYLYGTNNTGAECEYRYEWFSTESCVFTWALPISTNPTLICYPNNYKGIVDNTLEGLTFSSYPKCAIAIDAYKAWLAQSGAGRVAETFSNMMGLDDKAQNVISWGLNTFLSSDGGGVLNALGGIQDSLKQTIKAVVQSPRAKGQTGNNLLRALNKDHIDYYAIQVSKEYAEKIDSFWTQFGYPQKKIMDIDLNVRSKWNYIKTIDCAFTGNIELDLLSKFRSIFDNGVTIWHTDDIGNYSLENN